MTRPLHPHRIAQAMRDDEMLALIEARLREGSPDKARHITIGDDLEDASIIIGFAVLLVGVGLTLWSVLL